jgi:hypothetical protein
MDYALGAMREVSGLAGGKVSCSVPLLWRNEQIDVGRGLGSMSADAFTAALDDLRARHDIDWKEVTSVPLEQTFTVQGWFGDGTPVRRPLPPAPPELYGVDEKMYAAALYGLHVGMSTCGVELEMLVDGHGRTVAGLTDKVGKHLHGVARAYAIELLRKSDGGAAQGSESPG